ncbi:MAG: glycosyltransferase, partial [Pseudomonadota bacterium]
SCLFLGRLEPRKGIDILLEAWGEIQAALPGAQLTIAGDGPLGDAVRATPSITYHPPPDDAARANLLAQADLFLAPAPYGESYGLVLAEAAAAGAIPIAAANAGYA